ncbi:MAG: hypothetical protein JWM71_2174 [Solirubrobacteraceae bacterium]|nr:hypothetical protein [Solirubrobacteraceae bacterium]
MQSGAAKLERMSSPNVDTAVVALRNFVHLSGALRAQAVVPGEPGTPPALVSCTRLGPIEVLVGERAVELAHDVELEAPTPDLGDLRALPPFEVSAERGEVAGVIGGVDMVADAMFAVAAALGPQAAVVVELDTTTPDLPLVLSARVGEPLLVTLGDESFERP